MRHTITAHFYDDRESDRHVLDRIHSIHEKTHQSYGRILTEMLTSPACGTVSLPEKEIQRIADKTAEIVTDDLKKILPLYVAANTVSASVSGQTSTKENDLPAFASDISIPDEPDPDFSDSAIDFGFAGM